MDSPATGYQHRATRAIQRMVEFAPSTGGLALWVRHQDSPTDGPGPPAVTDGTTVFYAPAFARLPLREQVGVVAHEVLHIALRHPQRYRDLQALLGDVDLQLFNICADAVVNSSLSHLSWLRLPASAVGLDRLLAHCLGIVQEVEKSLLEWDVERLYRAIDDRRQPVRGGKQARRQAEGGGRQEQRPGSAAADVADAGPTAAPEARPDGPRAALARSLDAPGRGDLRPADTAAPREAPEAEAELSREWSERLLRAHAGDGEHSMLRTLLADRPSPRTPWQQLLRTLLARGLTPRPSVSWSRPTRSYIANQGRAGPQRRLPFEPGFSASQVVPRLVLIVDVSGSVDDELLTRFAREMEAIRRRLEAALTVIVGDDQVRSVICGDCTTPLHFTALQALTFHGGGGTDFAPLLAAARTHRPDVVVVLTDLQGPADFQPLWPVIWAVPEDYRNTPPPFGRKLVLV